MNAPVVRLTSLAHGGGCGCKLAPSVLRDLMAGQTAVGPFANLLVGTETGDDAAVYRLNDGTCVIATTDFFMPMVDDPFDFGRVAATNAISDVYAMGGTPIMALAILGMPIDKIPTEMVRRILEGGRAICAEAGIPVAGGHSIDCPEPVYGLAVIGTCREENIRRNSAAQAGDALILTKALGVGVYSSAVKKNLIDGDMYAEMVDSMTTLNKIGAKLAADADVHAITDVTGFGLLGHSLEMAQGSGATITIDWANLPFLDSAAALVQRGCVTGASHRNWTSYGEHVALPSNWPDWRRHLLTDPQTSGGLLVACAPRRAAEIAARIVAEGCPFARVIGRVSEGPARIVIA
ncbi:MAG: selenide, water dikinase SelD [Rhodoblastus sp.]|nr:selenide, water dikinase SelD [Rhodoblastus sp.]